MDCHDDAAEPLTEFLVVRLDVVEQLEDRHPAAKDLDELAAALQASSTTTSVPTASVKLVDVCGISFSNVRPGHDVES